MRPIRACLLPLAMLLVAGASGCGDDDPGQPAPEGPSWESTDHLMADFVTAIQEMDLDTYRAMLDPDFRLYLTQDTVDNFALPRPYFDLAEDLASTGRMFAGQPFTRPTGDVVPAITRIQFVIFEPEASWAVSPPESRIPGVTWAPFQVHMVIEQGNVGRLNVQGRIMVYLDSAEVNVHGQPQTRWTMVGLEDLTTVPQADKAAEDASWGSVKALYR